MNAFLKLNSFLKMKSFLKLIANLGIVIGCAVGLVIVFLIYFFISTPRPTNIKECLTTQLFEVRLCPKDKSYIRLKNISPHIRSAVIASEDSTFYSHNGFDWFELQQSFQTNLEKKTFARGGSTITQQLAKNVYLSAEKSLLRKAREALIVVQLEKILTKDEILEKYLNIVEFGPNLYGVGAATRHYFGKSPSEVTPAEAAFLAFLLPSPKKHSISFQKKQLTKFAHSQVRKIIERMYRFKKLSEDDYRNSVAQAANLFGGSNIYGDSELTFESEEQQEELSFDTETSALAPVETEPAPTTDSTPSPEEPSPEEPATQVIEETSDSEL